ncbi:hypothetical protein LPB72_05300 [Hydrogenophaga crassostreae]|uniref:Uncharacterized protein n=1 Tax=Hydrogenophaga crassostreae TaxID=1763535 RepID=A0A162Z2J9_9BURK|nr:hypothetical protein [Hydrogenophaga crassostreae]AOW14643.1 hypothetical protein LPB072_19250 [Hydrogenophaga crassostreae]OAD43260.1 hypothetical protein LPB72_05300 [Hydrogenophaga crassostreae]
MHLHLDLNLDSSTDFEDLAANSGPAPLDNHPSQGDRSMDAWPGWVHGTARNLTQIVRDLQCSVVVAVHTLAGGPAEDNGFAIIGLEMLATEQRTRLPRPSHFLEASQRLLTTLSRPAGTKAEMGLQQPQLWVARVCRSDAGMNSAEVRLNSSLVGSQMSSRTQEVLWMAQRHQSHRNFREAQTCFDTLRRKGADDRHDHELQLGLYRLIESLQTSDREARPSPWEVRSLAKVYVEREVGQARLMPLLFTPMSS